MKITKILSSLVMLGVCVSPLTSIAAQQATTSTQAVQPQLWPGTKYNSAIPTFYSVLGYNVGERITTHADMLRYFDALQQAAPDRIKVFEYGRTWEGRKLIYAAIGKPDNVADLEGFASKMQKLADPRVTDRDTAKNIIKTLPGSVWLEHGVHGNEISSTDAAMMTAYHLLAAKNDPVASKILSNTLVFIDPLQNPDGRTRFTNNYYSAVGYVHSGDRLSVEQNEPWPRGRSNHYLFDMNRDWLAITQPETAGRIKALNHYKPTVVIDLHEMGGDSSYFFVPAAQPINPFMNEGQLANNVLIGKNNAKYFDEFGFSYFTREVYDAFYPGYGDSWPTFYGASAATYEVASTRGEKYITRTGEEIPYISPVHKHFVASMATAEAVSDNREKILSDFYQYQVDAIKAGKDDDERTFIIPATRDKAGSHKLAALMAQHGVEVTQATAAFKACGNRYQAGAYIIDTAQPRGRFVKTTFTQQVDMADDFIKEQERRRARKLNDQIYDVTAWSLPLLFNVDTDACDRAVDVASVAVQADSTLTGEVINPDAKVAYIVPWGDMAAGQFLTAALQAGVSLKSADEAFVMGDKQRFAAGSLVIEVKANDKNIAETVAQIANETGAKVIGVDSSWVIEGPSFGSYSTVPMVAPKIAMAWDSPTSSLSAGSTRYVIEREFNYPVTAMRSAQIARGDLRQYQVLILPAGYYGGDLGQRGADNIKQWVEQGGVLITLANATKFASETGLLDVQREQALKDDQGQEDKVENGMVAGKLIEDKAGFIAAIENHLDSPDYVAGVLANVEVDQEHWLTAGVNPEVVSLVVGSDIYTPMKLASGKNVAWFAGKDKTLASGYLWKENQTQMPYKPFLLYQPTGRGMVIGYTQDPTSRAYLDGLNVMFMNTIFRAAAHANPVR